jgi:hypothetical protein
MSRFALVELHALHEPMHPAHVGANHRARARKEWDAWHALDPFELLRKDQDAERERIAQVRAEFRAMTTEEQDAALAISIAESKAIKAAKLAAYHARNA